MQSKSPCKKRMESCAVPHPLVKLVSFLWPCLVLVGGFLVGFSFFFIFLFFLDLKLYNDEA